MANPMYEVEEIPESLSGLVGKGAEFAPSEIPESLSGLVGKGAEPAEEAIPENLSGLVGKGAELTEEEKKKKKKSKEWIPERPETLTGLVGKGVTPPPEEIPESLSGLVGKGAAQAPAATPSKEPKEPEVPRIPLDVESINLMRNTYTSGAAAGGAGSVLGSTMGALAGGIGSAVSGVKDWITGEETKAAPDMAPSAIAPDKATFMKSIRKEADGSYSIPASMFASGGVPQGIKNEILRKQLPKLFPGLTDADFQVRSSQAGYATEESGALELIAKGLQQTALATLPLLQIASGGLKQPGRINRDFEKLLQRPDVDSQLQDAINSAKKSGKTVPATVMGAFDLEVSPEDTVKSLRQKVWETHHSNAINFFDEMVRSGKFDTLSFFASTGLLKFASGALSPVASKIPSLAKPELLARGLAGWGVAPTTKMLEVAAKNPTIARNAAKVFSHFPTGTKYLRGTVELLGGGAIENAAVAAALGGGGQDILTAGLTGVAPAAVGLVASRGRNLPRITPDNELLAARHLMETYKGDKGERFASGREPIPEYLTNAYKVNPEGVQLRLQGLIANADIVKSMHGKDPRANQELIVNAESHPKLREAIDRAIAVTPRVDENSIPMNTINGRRIGQAINEVLRQSDDSAKAQLVPFLADNRNLAGYDPQAFIEKMRRNPMLASKADVLENQFNETSSKTAYSHALLEILRNVHEGEPQNVWAAGLRRTDGRLLVDIGEAMHAAPEIQRQLVDLDTRYTKSQSVALKALGYAQEELAKLKEMYPPIADKIDSLQNNLAQTAQENIRITPDVAGRLQEIQRHTGESDIAMQIKRALTKYSDNMEHAYKQEYKANQLLETTHRTAPVKPSLKDHEAIIQQMLTPIEGATTREAVAAYFSKNLLRLDEEGPNAAALNSIIDQAADDIQIGGTRDLEKYNPETNPTIAAFIEEVPRNKALFENFYKGMKKLSQEAEILEVLSEQSQALFHEEGTSQSVGFLSNLRRASNDMVFEHNLQHLEWLRDESKSLWDYHAAELHLPDEAKSMMFDYLTGTDINRAKLLANPEFKLNTETAIQNALNAAKYVPRQMLEALDEVFEAVFEKKMDRELFIGQFINPFNDWGRNNDFAKGMLNQVKVQDAANFYLEHRNSVNTLVGEGWFSTSYLMEQNVARNAGVHVALENYAQGMRVGSREYETWVSANLPTKSPFFRRLVMDKEFSTAVNIIDGVELLPEFMFKMTQDGVYSRTEYGNAVHTLLTDERLNRKFQFEMSRDNKQFVQDYIFEKLYSAELARGEVSPKREQQLRDHAGVTYTYLRNSELSYQTPKFWKEAFDGHSKFKAMDYDLWQINKKYYEENNARTGVNLTPYKWREQHISEKKKLAPYMAMEFSMEQIVDPDRTRLFGSSKEGQLAKAAEISVRDEMQNPAEQILRKAHKVFLGGKNAHARYQLEETGALLKSMEYHSYGKYMQDLAQTGGNKSIGWMQGLNFLDWVNRGSYRFVLETFPKPVAITAFALAKFGWTAARVGSGAEVIGAGMMRAVSVINRLVGSMIQAASSNPPDFIRRLPHGAYQAAAFTNAMLVIPWVIFRGGTLGVAKTIKHMRGRHEANVSPEMKMATNRVLDGYRDSGRSSQLKLITEIAQEGAVGAKWLPMVQIEQGLNKLIGMGTRLFIEAPELANSQMVLERHAKMYEDCIKLGDRKEIYQYLSERLAQPAATLWQVATDTENAIKSGDSYGENAVRFLQNSHLATLTRFGPLAAPLAIKMIGQFLPGATLFYNAKVAMPSMVWSQIKGIKNFFRDKMPGTSLPDDKVMAISRVFSNILAVSAAMSIWQHGLPKPLADMIREENESDLRRSLAEGALRMFGLNLEKINPISVKQLLSVTSSIRGTSFLPTNIPAVGRALYDYYTTLFTDNPRIELLEKREMAFLAAGDVEGFRETQAERQKLSDLDAKLKLQRLFQIFEKNSGIPIIAFVKDCFSPTNVAYAIMNDRLDYERNNAQRFIDVQKVPGIPDLSLSDAYSPGLTIRKGLGFGKYIGQNYTFNYAAFYWDIKDFLWEGFPEGMQHMLARTFANAAFEITEKTYEADVYLNAWAKNGILTGTGVSISQDFARGATQITDTRVDAFGPLPVYPLKGQSENLQRDIGVVAGQQMQTKAQPKEVDSPLWDKVLDRLSGRSD